MKTQKYLIFFYIFFFLYLPSLASQENTSPNKKEETPKEKNLEAINKSWIQDIKEKDTDTDRKTDNERNTKNDTNLVPQNNPSPEAEKEDTPSFIGTLFRFIAFLCVFGVFAYLFLYFFQSKLQKGTHKGDEIIELIASVPLLQGKFLQIVDIAGQLFIIGVSDKGMQLISKIEESLVADRIRLWQSEQSTLPRSSGMLNILNKILQGTDERVKGKERFSKVLEKMSGKQSVTDDSQNIKRMLKQQKQKLSKLKKTNEKTKE